MADFNSLEVWFVTGSQHLYGPAVLKQVEADSQQIVAGLNQSGLLPIKIVMKPILTNPQAITDLCLEANHVPHCIGLVTWMHTFSPAKMWIAGLTALKRPFAHLHTQFNRDIPWSSIDMDFMNLNQSAHGGREFGFMCSRLRQNRKVIVGHWEDPQVQERLGQWTACGGGLARLPAGQDRAHWRQHARGGGDGRGQGCGADSVRLRGERLWDRRPGALCRGDLGG